MRLRQRRTVTGKNYNQTSPQPIYVNPFKTAMVAHNPTIELKKEHDNPEVASQFLKDMNAEESYNLLKCSKAWTVMVKIYQGPTTMQEPKGPSLTRWLGFGKKDPEYLNASAAQAHQTAEFLRKMRPGYEAYVLHHRNCSLVCVGQYDTELDPSLLAAQRALAGLQIKGSSRDQYNGIVLETLTDQPAAMKIPH